MYTYHIWKENTYHIWRWWQWKLRRDFLRIWCWIFLLSAHPKNVIGSTQASNTVHKSILDWVIDFNGISIRLGLFPAWRLGHHVHYTFIYTFIVSLFKSFMYSYMIPNIKWGVRGVMDIVVGNGLGETSSNPGWGSLHFT